MAEVSGGLDATAVTAIVSTLMPQAATTAPLPETVSGAPGSAGIYSPGTHTHPRLTSTTMATVATGSTATVNFTRTFAAKPGMVMTEIEGDTSASAQPAIFKVQSWLQDAGNNFTGAVIKVWRAQVVPQNLATLLLGAVYSIFGASSVGTNFSVVAIARSDV